MKKYYSIILALIMVFSLCACNKDDSPTIDDGNTPSAQTGNKANTAQFRGKLLEPTINLIATGNYMYEIKSPENDSPVTYARYANNYLITCTVNGVPTTYIVKDGKKYIAFATEKIYAQLSDTDLATYNIGQFEQQLNSADFSTFSTYTFKSAGETTVGGVNYKYEDYYSPLSQMTNRFCFDETNTLRLIAAVNNDGSTGDAFSISLYESNAGVFDALNTYTLVDLSTQTAMQPAN